MTERPMITQRRAFSCQACVPADYTDEQVKAYADEAYRCGTEHGWHVRKAGDPALRGDPERNPCEEREGFVHIMLDA